MVGLVRSDSQKVAKHGDGGSEIITCLAIGSGKLAPVGVGKGKVGQADHVRIDLRSGVFVDLVT